MPHRRAAPGRPTILLAPRLDIVTPLRRRRDRPLWSVTHRPKSGGAPAYALPEQQVRLIADERRVLPGARGHVPRRELREPRVARVRLGLNEVGEEAQLFDERLEHFGGLDAAVRGAEPRQARRSHWQRHDWVIAAVERRIQRYPGVGRQRDVPDAAT